MSSKENLATSNLDDSTKLILEGSQKDYSCFSPSDLEPSSSGNMSNLNNANQSYDSSPKSSNFFLSLVLDNKGSTARDHLANERTFLAWLRTSLALVTIGVAVTQISKLTGNKPEQPTHDKTSFTLLLGSIYMAIGIVFVFFGLTRYFYIQRQLIQGKFPASRYTIMLGVLLLLLISATLVYTFVGDIVI